MAAGTKEEPWPLKTPPGTSSYNMYQDDDVLVCQVGSTTLKYQFRGVDDLHEWLAKQGDWVPLGAADENKPAADAAGQHDVLGSAADGVVGGPPSADAGRPDPERVLGRAGHVERDPQRGGHDASVFSAINRKRRAASPQTCSR